MRCLRLGGWPAPLVLAMALLLTACAGRGPYVPTPRAASADAPLVFRLGAMEWRDDTAADAVDPGLRGAFSQLPGDALRDWAARRLQVTAAGPGRLRVIVTDASAVRTALEGTPGIKGWFTRDQAERVTVTLAVRLEAVRNDASPVASAAAQASANRTFAEKTPEAERRAGLDALLANALAALDREIEARVRAEMAAVLQ